MKRRTREIKALREEVRINKAAIYALAHQNKRLAAKTHKTLQPDSRMNDEQTKLQEMLDSGEIKSFGEGRRKLRKTNMDRLVDEHLQVAPIEAVVGSGNVFKDLGHDDEAAAALQDIAEMAIKKMKTFAAGPWRDASEPPEEACRCICEFRHNVTGDVEIVIRKRSIGFYGGFWWNDDGAGWIDLDVYTMTRYAVINEDQDAISE